jgi:hypothetical protein
MALAGALALGGKAPVRRVARVVRTHRVMVKVVVAFFVCPWYEQATVAVPPVPDDCMCQVQLATPLLPTVRAEPSNERGAEPVEYTTLAVQTAPTALLA